LSRKNLLQRLRNDYWERFGRELEHDIYGAQKRIWKVLRGMKKTVNENIEIKTINEETWVKYFETLYLEQETEEHEDRSKVHGPPQNNKSPQQFAS